MTIECPTECALKSICKDRLNDFVSAAEKSRADATTLANNAGMRTCLSINRIDCGMYGTSTVQDTIESFAAVEARREIKNNIPWIIGILGAAGAISDLLFNNGQVIARIIEELGKLGK